MLFNQFMQHGSGSLPGDAWLQKKLFWKVTRKGAIESTLYLMTLVMGGLLVAALMYR